MRNIRDSGFQKPIAAQSYALPIILSGRDLMTCAQTGSGKTVAFLFPIITALRKVLHERRNSASFGGGSGNLNNNNNNGNSSFAMSSAVSDFQSSHTEFGARPLALIITPTRELAQQIHSEALKFSWRTGLKCVCVFGGASSSAQIGRLRSGCDLLVATPGRLKDFLQQGVISVEQVRFLVLDEADRMLDMGFEPEIREIVERHRMPAKGQGRQTLMFSATFPREIQQLASSFLHRSLFLTVGRVGAPAELVQQQFILVPAIDTKAEQLIALLRQSTAKEKGERVVGSSSSSGSGSVGVGENSSALFTESVGRVPFSSSSTTTTAAANSHRQPAVEASEAGLTLIFAERKASVDYLSERLRVAGFSVVALHGDHSQGSRNRALQTFSSGRAAIMVATNVAARGLDIPNVAHVINYDMPHAIDDYVHRIGRTGRAGRRGRATTFLTREDAPIADPLAAMLREARLPVPPWLATLGPVVPRMRRFAGTRFQSRDGQ